MDLKQKVLGLLTSREGEESPLSTSFTLEEHLGLTLADIRNLDRSSSDNKDTFADAGQSVFDTIEAGFVDEYCDGGRYQLMKFPNTIDLHYIRHQRQVLGIQLSGVTNKLFSMIHQKQTDCADELCKVLELQESLDMALGMCSDGRLHINEAKNNLTTASLGLLAHYRRQHHLIKITKSLKTIHTLGKMSERVQELLGEQSYAAAIQLIVEGQHVAKTYQHFNCVAQLRTRLQDTMELAEEQLDFGLSKSAEQFDACLYSKLQSAFRLLGKQSTALDQLNLHFASGLHQETLCLLRKYAELSHNCHTADITEQKFSSDVGKLQFSELCGFIDSKLYIACLSELSTCLWKVTVNYHKTHQWHTEQVPIGGFDSLSLDPLEQKLRHGRTRLWQDVQNKIRTLLSSFNVWHLSIDELLEMLHIVDTLVEMGKQFCDSYSDVLKESVRQQSVNYFRGFHHGKLEELRVFLENESWEQCPVRANFNAFHLIEFRFLNQSTLAKSNSEVRSKKHFYLMDLEISPFSSLHVNCSFEEKIINCAYEEHSHDNIDGKTDIGPSEPVLANTTLSMLRLFGRYINFMHLLKTIAFDVLICLNQLFDYYLYAVYKLFVTPTVSLFDATPPKLRAVLLKIEETLILKSVVPETPDTIQDNTAFSSSVGDKVASPKICLPCQMDQPNQLFGLKLRLIAAESVMFLAHQLEFLRPYLVNLIPSAKEPLLHQFFLQITSVARDLRISIFGGVAHRFIDAEHIISLMSRVQWELKEVMSQHSSYVDHILQILCEFDTSLSSVCNPHILPPVVYNILWDQIIRRCYHALLDGFSAVRRCTNEGRALMQLDLRHFQVKVESVTRLRPLPDAAIVETYIKAYYLPENALEKWIQEQTDYSPRQLMNLLQCVSQGSKKIRLNLSSFMEDLDLNRR